MFCWRCGVILQRRNGELCCPWSELMCLSPRLEKVLTERFGLMRKRPAASITKQDTNKNWFCPGCGSPLNEELECASCGQHLRDLVFHLVELHPH